MNLRFTDVVKRYNQKMVLDHLSFDISTNACVALVGNNGCGKSTTINIICNLLKYDGGEYTVDGTLVTPHYLSFKRDIGMLLSRPHYIESFTIDEYWHFVGKYHRISATDATARIEDLCHLLSLENERNKAIRKLSSGNKMKVSIGAALLHNPKTIVLDEPFVNLDIKTTDSVIDVLKSFKNKKTMVVTSHDLDTVANLCDEFLIMDQGKIVLHLHKNDFSDTETLKKEIKAKLTIREDIQNLAWLN